MSSGGRIMPRAGRPIADELREWRVTMALTQAEAAEALRVPVRTLAGWEQGRPCVLAETVLALMAALRQQRAA